MRIVTPEEMQALEARFMAETGVSSATLMGRAAEGLLRAAVELTGRSGPVPQETHRLAARQERTPRFSIPSSPTSCRSPVRDP